MVTWCLPGKGCTPTLLWMSESANASFLRSLRAVSAVSIAGNDRDELCDLTHCVYDLYVSLKKANTDLRTVVVDVLVQLYNICCSIDSSTAGVECVQLSAAAVLRDCQARWSTTVSGAGKKRNRVQEDDQPAQKAATMSTAPDIPQEHRQASIAAETFTEIPEYFL